MNSFPYVPASESSLIRRRPVFGIGINDAEYTIQQKINGKFAKCPYYMTWKNMLRRCYDIRFHSRQPTYMGCSICDDWVLFSNFKLWMETQDWNGKQLDKDIILPGNKIYSPETCAFVDHSANSLFKDSLNTSLPKGVGIDKTGKKYTAFCGVDGKCLYLGSFDYVDDAECAYKKEKKKQIIKVANRQTDRRVTSALIQIANQY